MIDRVIDKMEEMVDEIYTPDQTNLQQRFLDVIDAIGGFLQWMAEQGYQVDLSEDLEKLQVAMEKKDYIQASDILLLEMQPDFRELKKNMN